MVFLEKNQGKKTILHMLMYQAWKKTKKTTPFFGKKPKSSVRDSHSDIFVQLNKVKVHYILFFCKIPENAKKLREIEFGSGKDRNSQYLVQYPVRRGYRAGYPPGPIKLKSQHGALRNTV